MLTKTMFRDLPPNVHLASTLDGAIRMTTDSAPGPQIESVFVIGGFRVFEEAMKSQKCTRIWLTRILKEVDDCDTFFPPISPDAFALVKCGPIQREESLSYRFEVWQRINEPKHSVLHVPLAETVKHEEYQYLNLVKDVLEEGTFRVDRTGTGVHLMLPDVSISLVEHN